MHPPFVKLLVDIPSRNTPILEPYKGRGTYTMGKIGACGTHQKIILTHLKEDLHFTKVELKPVERQGGRERRY